MNNSRYIDILGRIVPGLTVMDVNELSQCSLNIKAMLWYCLRAFDEEYDNCSECERQDCDSCEFAQGECEHCKDLEAIIEKAGLTKPLAIYKELDMERKTLKRTLDDVKEQHRDIMKERNGKIEELVKDLDLQRKFEEWNEKLNNFVATADRELDLD